MRLFWKIFFILMLTLLATVAASSWLSQKWLEDHSASDARLSLLANLGGTAIDLYQQEGRRSFGRWLITSMRRHHFRGALVNQYGDNILHRPLPPGFQQLAKRALLEKKQLSIIQRNRLLVATPVFMNSRPYYWLAMSRLKASQIHQSQRNSFIIRIAIILFALIIISWWLTRMFTRPIHSLQTQTKQLAMGNLHLRSDHSLVHRKDELGELARGFDDMAEKLQILMQSQKQLLRDISHELRSPLARLQVALELARNESNGTAESELNRIEKEAAQINELIGEVLTLARFEQAEVQKHLVRIELHELVAEIVSDAAFEAESVGKIVRCDSLNQCSITTDKMWLTRALDNVIRNALQHCQHQVNISLICEHQQVNIYIQDDGNGVDDAVISKLFEPFFRASEARERHVHNSQSGYGLGLAIAKRAIELHDGNIRAHNHVDGGLKISITLPIN